MADIVPIGKHREFYRQTKRSAAGVLRDCRTLQPMEVLVIGVDPHGEVFVQASPCDPGNSLWLMEMAKKMLLDPNG